MTNELVPYRSNHPVTRHLPTPRGEKSGGMKVEYLTEPEYIALLDAARLIPEHALLMRLLWETGLRISEALNLTYNNVYPDGVNIMRGKGNKQRFVPCQATVLGELLRQGQSHGRDKVFQKITTEPGALYMMRRYGKAIGLTKRIHPHLFRHSFAINFIRQTGNPFALQDIGGWSDMETIKIYMRLAKEAPREAIDKMRFPQ
jgi:integrase